MIQYTSFFRNDEESYLMVNKKRPETDKSRKTGEKRKMNLLNNVDNEKENKIRVGNKIWQMCEWKVLEMKRIGKKK